ncbi:hypothetical protein MGSAQ_000863, partial [marine sediment metagenome]
GLGHIGQQVAAGGGEQVVQSSITK